MYAILYLPTNSFVKRLPNYTQSENNIVQTSSLKVSFYSRKEAEKYKRRFLVAYYSFIQSAGFVDAPKTLKQSYLKKRNKYHNYNFTFAALMAVLGSVDFLPLQHYTVPEEFIIVEL